MTYIKCQIPLLQMEGPLYLILRPVFTKIDQDCEWCFCHPPEINF